MAFAVIAFDGPDPARRAAQRDRHIASITAMAEEGLLLLGLPLHGARRGSLMIVAAEDRAGLEAYLAREPFAAEGVWQDIACRPIRIPRLFWPPWPRMDAPLPDRRSHTVFVARGPVAATRFGAAAASGLLTFAAETLDAPGAILVTTHAEDAPALHWARDDAALRASSITIHPTLFRPLPYRPLPRPG